MSFALQAFLEADIKTDKYLSTNGFNECMYLPQIL